MKPAQGLSLVNKANARLTSFTSSLSPLNLTAKRAGLTGRTSAQPYRSSNCWWGNV